MSKRYVIQVCQWNHDCETGELVQKWENVQHPTGGDWMSRSKTKALNHAVFLTIKGETRPLRVGVSQPVYAVTALPELDVAEAVALAKEIGKSMADEAASLGITLSEVADLSDDDDDDDDTAPLDIVELENDVAPVVFEVVDEPKPKTAKYENPDGSVAEFEI